MQVAVRTLSGGSDTLNWILSDHLGSTNVTANADGTPLSEMRYTAFGEVRQSSGTTETPYQYTGQLSQMEEIKLYYYVARWYDPQIAHFVQADTIVPDLSNSKTFDRYVSVNNNPIRYSDPSGHRVCEDWDALGRCVAYGNPEPIVRSDPTPVLFEDSPVKIEDLTSIQYFGGTQFAFEEGAGWNYPSDCGGYHCGMDFGAGTWGASAYAMGDGEVKAIKNQSESNAKIIVVESGEYQILYWNVVDIKVKPGDKIIVGTLLGGVGNHQDDPKAKNFHIHLELKSVSPGRPEGSIPDYRHNPLLFMKQRLQEEIIDTATTLSGTTTLFHFPGQGPYDQPKVIGSVPYDSFFAAERVPAK